MPGYTAEELTEIYQFYQFGSYCLLKWCVTVPACFVGNVLDLCTLGFSKKVIDATPVTTKIPFFWEATRAKEKEWYASKESADAEHYIGGNFVNKGFAGVLRTAASIAVEIPANIAAVFIAAVCTVLHVLLSPIVKNIGEVVANNMCGCK